MSNQTEMRAGEFRRAVVAAIISIGLAFSLGRISAASARGAGSSNGPPASRTGRALSEPVIFGQVPVSPPLGDCTASAGLRVTEELPAGSRIVALDPIDPDRGIVNLTAGFLAAGRPDISFDGQRILFVGRRTGDDRFNVCEMNLDGTGTRQVTDRDTDCLAAIYLSTIYTIDADRPTSQIAFLSSEQGSSVQSLYTCRWDGTRIRRITFNPYGVFDPQQLSDGRLLYSSRRAPGTEDDSSLFTVHSDGADISAFAAAHEPPARRGMPCETVNGEVVYVKSAGGSDPGGSLVAVSRSRSLHTRRAVTHDPVGLYHSPSALPDGRLLASYHPLNGAGYRVQVLDPATGKRNAEVYAEGGWHCIDAVVARPRPEPAGRASVVDDRVRAGLLYCMNAYLSDRTEAARIRDGQIRRVQVFRPRKAAARNGDLGATDSDRESQSRGGLQGEELLGEAPVEPDGSLFLEVPPRTPVRLQTLDESGAILQRMDTWIWVMPRESRGCIGCHEDRELTPPNRHVLALRRLPTKIGVGADQAFVPADEAKPEGDQSE